MIYSELLSITELLKRNPNIPDLKNEDRTKIRRNIKSLKDELELFSEDEKDILKKYKINLEKDINEQVNTLKNKTDIEGDLLTFENLSAELALMKKAVVMAGETPFKLTSISEEEFWILCKKQEIKQGEQTFTFAMSGDEIDLLAKYILAPEPTASKSVKNIDVPKTEE